MISSQELVYFVESARTGNFSRAAERLGVTQPAITSALHRLEDAVGVKLFHRSRSGVRLTKAGEALLQESQNLLAQWDRIARSVKQSSEEVMGTYVLGCHASVALYSLPQTLPGLLVDFPNLRFELRHDLSRKITEQVIHGEVDLAIAVNPVRHPDLVIRPICKDRVSFYTSTKATSVNQEGSETPVLLCNPEFSKHSICCEKPKNTFLEWCRRQAWKRLPLLPMLAEALAFFQDEWPHCGNIYAP